MKTFVSPRPRSFLVIATIRVGNSPFGVTVKEGGFPSAPTVDLITNRIYVANSNSNSVSVINGFTNNVIANMKTNQPVNRKTNRI